MFYIQNDSNKTLLDILTSSAVNAIEGGGTFAFVTETGVHKFLESIEMESLLTCGNYKLIVGTDKVTNSKTIERLDKLQKYFNGLSVSAFLNDKPNILYHPKMCWFKYEKGAKLIIGSGNLTESGLTKNIEMFVVNELSNEEFFDFKSIWDNWINKNINNIKLLSDNEICEKVKNNNIIYTKIKEKISSKESIVETLIETLSEENFNEEIIKEIENDSTDTNDILIHEICRNGDRFSQMNFNLDVVNIFFEVNVNSIKKFKNINLDGSFGSNETRPFVLVKSRNFRFELDGLSGKSYPKQGRPIAIFQKMNCNQYTYAIIMPDDNDFNMLQQYLYKYTSIKRANRMKICYTNQYILKNEVPNLRIFK